MIFLAISEKNLLKKIIFLNISQNALIFLFVMRGLNFYSTKKTTAPFYNQLSEGGNLSQIVDPVPQALMLTAIVVGFSISAIAIAVVIKIKKSFKSIEEDQIEHNIITKNIDNLS
jgi:multicomponent Na+:H+ antiporter subunit C